MLFDHLFFFGADGGVRPLESPLRLIHGPLTNWWLARNISTIILQAFKFDLMLHRGFKDFKVGIITNQEEYSQEMWVT